MPAERFIHTAARWVSIAAGVAAATYLLSLFYIYLASEAVIERRYTLPSSLIQASTGAEALARGKHWMTISGCFGCHGDDLKGRVLRGNPYLTVHSGNLRTAALTYADGDFERAIRHGLMPDARPMWLMPSGTFAYMRERDVEDIIAYIRAQPVDRAPSAPRPQFTLKARRAILAARLVPTSPKADEIVMPPDEGPRYDGGRYLATIACAQCHGGDLTGSDTAPDLNIALRYTRPQFFRLMREGQSNHGWLPTMSPLARARFHDLRDYEIMALYDYFVARKMLPPVPKAVGAKLR